MGKEERENVEKGKGKRGKREGKTGKEERENGERGKGKRGKRKVKMWKEERENRKRGNGKRRPRASNVQRYPCCTHLGKGKGYC